MSEKLWCGCGRFHDPAFTYCWNRMPAPVAATASGIGGTGVAVTSGIPDNPRITERAQALLTGNLRRYAILITDEQLAPALDAFQRHRHLGDATALREALIVLLEEGP